MPQTAHTTNRTSAAPAPRYVPVTGDFLTAADFDLSAEASELWRQVTEEQITDLRKRAGRTNWRWMLDRLRRIEDRPPCMLVHAAKLMIWLAGPGKVPRAKLMLIPLFLQRVVDRCFAGNAQRCFNAIDRDELNLEAQENQLGLERRIAISEGRELSADALLKEAEAHESEAATSLELASALRRRARSLDLRSTASLRQAAV